MKNDGVDVAEFRWGDSGDPSEATDTSWISFNELPNADLLIMQLDVGPSTKEGYDSLDYEHWVHITNPHRSQFMILLMHIAFGSEGALVDIEDLKLRCAVWEVPFTEGGRAIGAYL